MLDRLRTLHFLGSLFAVLLISHPATAGQQGDFQSKAKQAVLMDAASGALLYRKAADDLVPPASMSKLMTLTLIFKALKNGEITLETPYKMSENAWRKGGAPSRTSAMMVPLNTSEPISQLLQGVIVESGNDAAMALAEGYSGSEDAFSQKMTEEARRLGLKKSTFKNATGLYHAEHLMTATELAQLARHIITEYPQYYTMFAQKEFLYRKHRFINRNRLLQIVPGADGLKTGHLSLSGAGVVGSAVQDGKRLIVVVHGLANEAERNEEAARLMAWGFQNTATVNLFEDGEVVGHARVWGGTQMYVPLAPKGALSIVLPKYPANQKLSGDIVYTGPLKPPVKKGDKIGVLRVTSSSSAVNEVPLYATEDVEQGSFMRQGIDSLMVMALKKFAL